MKDANATSRKQEPNRSKPDLAALASQAAITLDRKARGIDVPVDSVYRLAEFYVERLKLRHLGMQPSCSTH
jgi:hypothetical protein